MFGFVCVVSECAVGGWLEAQASSDSSLDSIMVMCLGRSFITSVPDMFRFIQYILRPRL